MARAQQDPAARETPQSQQPAVRPLQPIAGGRHLQPEGRDLHDLGVPAPSRQEVQEMDRLMQQLLDRSGNGQDKANRPWEPMHRTLPRFVGPALPGNPNTHHWAAQWMERVREVNPNLRLADVGTIVIIHRPEDLARWADTLRQAGLPEWQPVPDFRNWHISSLRHSAPEGSFRA